MRSALGRVGACCWIPIIVIVKVLSQHFEQPSPLAELLGD